MFKYSSLCYCFYILSLQYCSLKFLFLEHCKMFIKFPSLNDKLIFTLCFLYVVWMNLKESMQKASVHGLAITNSWSLVSGDFDEFVGKLPAYHFWLFFFLQKNLELKAFQVDRKATWRHGITKREEGRDNAYNKVN